MATFVAPTVNGNWTNTGNEEYQYGLNGNDTLSPDSNSRSYMLSGGVGDDTLIGQSYDDDLYGGNNADYLYGDYGNDNLYGGRGQDSFVFDTTLNKNNNVDFIGDFESGSGGDLIQLSRSIFKSTGNEDTFLQAKKFEVNDQATKSKTRILYNEDKGILFFTKNGDAGNKVKFATLTPGVQLDNDDFYIIA